MRAGQPRNGARAELPARAKASPLEASLECQWSSSCCETGGSQIAWTELATQVGARFEGSLDREALLFESQNAQKSKVHELGSE